MDHLPPTIADQTLLALLGRLLAASPAPQSATDLRSSLFQPGFSWQALVDLAVAHEVLPALIFSLRERAFLPPLSPKLTEEARAAHVTSRLAASYAEHLERQSDLRAQLLDAIAALNAEDIIPVLLKGAAHLTIEQPTWHEARAMRDLDILVPAEQAARAHALLASRGYRADPNPPPLDRHLPELFMPGRAGTIEIHVEALSFPSRYALGTDEVLRLAEERSSGGVTFKLLPAQWHALHGLLHHQLSDRGHARRMLAIKGLWEFAKMGAELSPQDWNDIIEHAGRRKVFDMLSSWTVQANLLFGLAAPDALLCHEPGRRHAEATFKRARMSYAARQVLFVTDKLLFAFAPRTLAARYGENSASAAALRHVGFLWSNRRQTMQRWLGR